MGKSRGPVHTNPLATDRTRTDDEHIHEEDKQLLHTERGKLAMPKNEDNPALAELKRKRVPRSADGK